MPISYALLLCIPIGFLFFFIARLTSRLVIGRYEGTERRASAAFSVFGALLIPTIWVFGHLQEDLPNIPPVAIAFSLFALEVLILAVIFRPFPPRGLDAPERKGGSEP
jgi:hypothetical protein